MPSWETMENDFEKQEGVVIRTHLEAAHGKYGTKLRVVVREDGKPSTADIEAWDEALASLNEAHREWRGFLRR